MMALIAIDEVDRGGKNSSLLSGHPFLRLGFRPFYLLGAAFAAVSIPAWLLRYYGLAASFTHIDLNWHAHEMVYGFAVAIIVGFLYTAGRAWTGLWTPRGAPLAAIALLWLAGRVAMLLAAPLPAALVDLLFLPVAVVPLYRVLKRAGSKRNLFLIALLALLALGNLGFHAARLGWITLSPLHMVQVAIMIIVMMEAAIGGRVIPNFTAGAIPGAHPVTDERRDRITLALTAGAGIAWALALPAYVVAGVAGAAAVAQIMRLAGWKPLCTLHTPLLWILHASYAWLALGLVLLAMAALGLVAASAAFHVLAVGSMAGLIIGMITRTALGHTGRPLQAGASETAMYLLMQAGVATRLLAAVGPSATRDVALVVSAACWSLAFLTYVMVYGPYLFRARIDGKEG
jgi:uncharacterized protein involved in response to NO